MQLVERAAQLNALNSALAGVGAGEGRVALVYGEAGIGKTSVVEQFEKQNAKSWRVLSGACDLLFTPRPLGPLGDVALQVKGQLLQLLESGAPRDALFSACLLELQGQPTILVIEDIHWADEATLDLLKYLGRRIRQTCCLLLLTYRDDEIGDDSPLRLLLGDLAASRAIHRIPVPALTIDGVRELANGRDLDAAALHHLTDGNPFFLTEILVGKGAIPQTVRDAMLARAARLSQPARYALEAAAVAGLRVEAWLLDQMIGSDGAGIAECISRGLLQEQGNEYAFRHELARQTILESMSLVRRRDANRKALAALKEHAETCGDLARLASHAEGTGDAQLVLEYAPAAALHAAAAGAHRQAAILYELALRFADVVPAALHAQMLEAYSRELFFDDRLTETLLVLRRAMNLWRSLGDRLSEGRNLAWQGEYAFGIERNSEAERASQAAIAVLETLPASAELAEAYKAQCFIRMMHRDSAEASFWGEKAITLAERFNRADTIARTYNYMGCAMMPVNPERGRQLLERSLAVSSDANIVFARAGAWCNLGWTLIEIFELDDAERVLAQGIAYASEYDDDYHLRTMWVHQGRVQFYRGAWSKARDAALRVLGMPHLDAENRCLALLALAPPSVRRGEPDVPTILTEAVEASEHTSVLPMLGPARAAWAENQWLGGDYGTISREIRDTYELAVKKKHPWFAGELAFWLWRAGDFFTPPEWIARPYALQIAGDWHGAAQEWGRRGCPYEQAMALMDGDQAAQLAALEIFEGLGARPILEKLRQKLRAEGVHGIPRGPRPTTRENQLGLTAREMEVLACVVNGASNSTIARQLSLSVRTVEHHMASMLQKTGVQSRGELVALASREMKSLA